MRDSRSRPAGDRAVQRHRSLHRSGIALGGSRSGRIVRDRLRLSIRPLTPHGVTCPLARRNRDRLGTYVDLSLPHNNVPESRDAPRLEGRVGGAFAMRRSIASITEVVAALSSALRIRNRIDPPCPGRHGAQSPTSSCRSPTRPPPSRRAPFRSLDPGGLSMDWSMHHTPTNAYGTRRTA